MYGRKLRGDVIDPSLDFRGSVANRSKLSICTLPPLQAIIGENPKTTNAELLANQYIEAKHKIDQRKPVPVTRAQKLQSVPLPKKRGERASKVGGGALFQKLGKRISTFGNIIENFETREPQQRSISLPQPQTAPMTHQKLQIQTQHKPQFQLQEQPQSNLQKPRNTVQQINARQPIHTYYDHSEVYQPDASYNNLKHDFGNTNRIRQDHIVVQNLKRSNGARRRSVHIAKMDEAAETKLRDHNSDKSVRAKDNQISLNLSDDSSSSLYSRLLESYSHMNLDHDSNYESGVKTISRSKSKSTDLVEFPRSNRGSAIVGTSTHDSTSTSNDLFSLAHSSDTSGSSEFVSLPGTGDRSSPSFSNPLFTTNYNKELPPVPAKKMDQSILRDYSGSEQDSKIIDYFVPPEVPKHKVLQRSSSQREESDIFYDCDNFSFSSSTHSFEKTHNTSPVRLTKKKVQLPADTAVFTRKTRQMKADVPVGNVGNRSASWQYLKNAGIEPFMLSGYQSNTNLKVINQ